MHLRNPTRINAAKTILRTTDRRVGDVAQETGFFDHAHFIRTFKRKTDLSPAQYRQRNLTPSLHVR